MSQVKIDPAQININNGPLEPNTVNRNKLVALSALMTGMAGVIHLWIVPEHWRHSQAHAVFFLLVGVVQIAWGVAVWRRPSTRLYYIGAGMAGWLIVLYGITRWLSAPFGHGPEEIDMIGIVTKVFEGLGMIALVILIFQDLNFRAGRLLARKAIALILLISFVAGFVTYGVALAAEPIFPGLSAPEEEHHHDETHSSLTYVIDQNGNLRLTFWPDPSPEDIASDLKILLVEK
jgi:hypothetical protein